MAIMERGMAVPGIDELRVMRAAAARAAIINSEFLPIFERIDQDCADREALASSDPVAILRAQLEQERRATA